MGLNILVTGANGFIGANLAAALEPNHRVIRCVRKASAENNTLSCLGIGDLSATTEWSQALQSVDVVIHTAARVHVLYESVAEPIREFRAVNVQATERLARAAARAGVKRLIFISTIGVLGNYSIDPFSETDMPNPSNDYSASKWEAEQRLHRVAEETGLEVVIIRPPLVYGPNVKANFYRLMSSVDTGQFLPFGWVKNARDFLSVVNLSHFVTHVLEHPAAANQTFLVADNEPISTPQLICKLGQFMQRTPRLLPVPMSILQLGAAILQKDRLYHSVCSSLRIKTDKAQQLLDWKPVQSLEEGLMQTVEWYLAQPLLPVSAYATKSKAA